MDKEFASGIYFNSPSDKAPDFVKGSLSVKPEAFISWLQSQKPNSKGYVRMSIKESKNGRLYVELDTWEPKMPSETMKDDFEDDIPF